MNISVAKVIKSFKNQLASIYPLTEINSIIELVFEHVIEFNKTDLILKQENILSNEEMSELQSILERLQNNEPIQYILGKTTFYDLIFNVAPGVLIPRQETEELVDWIIMDAKNLNNLNILDIGTGSGCIAIALAANIYKSKVTAFDVSDIALEIANNNSKLNNIKIYFEKVDILKPVQKNNNREFDIIVSNPPYILEKERNLMAKNVLDYEPELALFIDNNVPLLFYNKIIDYSRMHLRENGKLYFEINEAYGQNIKELLDKKGFKNIELRKDLSGKERMIKAIK